MEDVFMDLLTLLTLAVGLAMDAFAVSICKGLAMREKVLKKGIIVGLWFGGFQALMPTIGFFLGTQFKDQITSIDHWIAFVLLGLIGINMVKEALSNDEEQADDSIAVKEMFMLAVATSIDALAVGITFAFLNVHIVSAASMIGVCTFLISFAGVKIGNIFGTKYKSKAELAGGIILILLGFKILFEINHQTSKEKEKVRLNFLSPGEYEFDDISLITVPKKDVLAKLKERKKNSMKQIQYDGNHFRGVYHAKKDQILCVTIPYSKGWKATVNGKRAKIYKANGMFMGIVMKKGTQSVRLDYETPGLKIGACISFGAWIGLGIYGLYLEKYRKKLLNQC